MSTKYKYESKYRDWACPTAGCKVTQRTLPTHYAPTHRISRSVEHTLVPVNTEVPNQ